MGNRLVILLAAGLAVAAGPLTTLSGHVRYQAADVHVLVDEVPLQRYVHAGRWYVEAVKGREYAIRLRNPYGVRVAVALSVDGLNTIDARETTAAEARKWVLSPYETVTMRGWQTSRNEARRFEFTTEAHSYGQGLGKTENLGVISAAFFKERVAAVRGLSSRSQTLNEGSADAVPSAVGSPAVADRKANEYAATGMGRATGHAITEVWLDLEDTPSDTVNIRYEFRAGLVRLGILPDVRTDDRLQRRERARGFEPGFCPEPDRQR